MGKEVVLEEVCMATTFFFSIAQKPRVFFALLLIALESRLGYGGLDLEDLGRAWRNQWNLGQWTLICDRIDSELVTYLAGSDLLLLAL